MQKTLLHNNLGGSSSKLWGSSSRTVLVTIMSGLGNQLFMYAAARWAEKRLGVRAFMVDANVDTFAAPNTRVTQITELLAVGPMISGRFAKALEFASLSRRVQAYIAKFGLKSFMFEDWPWETARAVMETSVRNHRYPIWRGYFMYEEILADVLVEFQRESNPRIKNILHKTSQTFNQLELDPEHDCVMHVRLGDYHKYQLPTLDASYYQNSIHELQQRGFQGRLFFISDEPWSAEALLQCLKTRPVLINVSDPLVAFCLFSGIKYKIISNSTFSFWSALISTREEGEVAFPENWSLSHICRKQGWVGVRN